MGSCWRLGEAEGTAAGWGWGDGRAGTTYRRGMICLSHVGHQSRWVSMNGSRLLKPKSARQKDEQKEGEGIAEEDAPFYQRKATLLVRTVHSRWLAM